MFPVSFPDQPPVVRTSVFIVHVKMGEIIVPGPVYFAAGSRKNAPAKSAGRGGWPANVQQHVSNGEKLKKP